jgi:hypothetical protein
VAEDSQVDGVKTGEKDPPLGEKLMWKEMGHVAENEQIVEREESDADQRGEVNG